MKKIFFTLALYSASIGGAFAALPLTGFYKTIDDETKNAKSVVELYECGTKTICGKIIALYDSEGKTITETAANATKRAEKIEGAPLMVGLQIVRDMRLDSDEDDDDIEYDDGKITDPKTGKVYSCEIWQDDDDAKDTVSVRGKIGPFGRTQIWYKTQKPE